MKNSRVNIVKICIAAFFIIAVIVPLFRMLFNIIGADAGKIITSDQFGKALVNSLKVASTATFFSLVLALLISWCVTRTNIRLKAVISVVVTLPMLIPSLSHGMGLIILFGNNGILTNLLGLKSNFIYGFWGIVAGSVMYSFPIAFLMLADVMKYEDGSPYEATNVLGIPKWRQFTAITFPYLRKPLISVIFAVFTMVITDYGVPLMIGGDCRTLPVMMYHEVIGDLNFGKGSVIGAVLLVPAVAAFIIDLLNKDKGNTSFVTRKIELKSSKVKNSFSYLLCLLTIIAVTVPVLSFALLTFAEKYPSNISFTLKHITGTFAGRGDRYLLNSVIISLFVAFIGIISVFIVSYITARMPSKMSKFLHLISIMSLAIPGLVLGLSYVLVFKGSFLSGTLAILVLVNLVHFFASPYLMMYNMFNKLNENLELVGMTLGISRLRMIKDVFIPQTKSTITEACVYFFVNSMMTISAVSFLSTASTKPIAIMLPEFEAQMVIERAAFVSLLILCVNLFIKLIAYLIKRQKKYERET